MRPPESAKARPNYGGCGAESPGKGASANDALNAVAGATRPTAALI
jgi:hypothetical protein